MAKSRIVEAIRAGCVDIWAASVHWKDSPSAPPPPDYVGAATAQGAANEATARVQGRLNNPNITNPFGTQTVKFGTPGTFDQAAYDAALQKWQNTPDTPTTTKVVSGYDDEGKPVYTDIPTGTGRGEMPTRDQFTTGADKDQVSLTQTLNPQQQALLDQQLRISGQVGNVGEAGLGRVSNAFNQSLDVSGAKDLQNKAEQAYFSRLDPIWNQREQQTETQLRNQGLVPGGEAYDNAMRDFNFGRNDAYQQGILGAIQTAPQALQQEVAIRNQPLAELNALRTGAQPQIPQFQPYAGSNIAAPPLFAGAQAQAQANQGLYNAQVGQSNAFNSGLFNLAGASAYGSYLGLAALAASDRRLKSNVRRIGMHPLGIGVYEYDIFDRHEVGVMADEVETVRPEAVVTHPSGFKMVNYGML